MIYKFRILSDEDKDFARELLICDSGSFLDFHNCLQKDLGYDPMQLASFFITNSNWEKKTQITLIDMMDEENENVITMDQAVLKDYLKGNGDRMLYVFDFFSERSFFIELTETVNIEDKHPDAKIVFSHGDPPEQINLGLDMGIPDDFDEDPEDMDEDFQSDIDFMDLDDLPEE